jgi:ATP-dependent Clp protease ATP-binding subunit ClpA
MNGTIPQEGTMSDTDGMQQQDQGGADSGFTPPATQDELNRIISERVSRERAKYADYNDLKKQASKYAEFEESQKSEVQRATERADALERQLAEVQLTAARAEIAATSGVPLEALRGASREELEAHAETLKALLTAQQRGPVVSNPGGIPANAGGGDERAFARALFGNH